jgi:hypothetical protein
MTKQNQFFSRKLGHVVTQLDKALGYKPEGHGSIPHDVIGIFH